MSLLLIMRTTGLVHNFQQVDHVWFIISIFPGEMLGAAPELPDDSSDDDDLSNRGRSDAFNSSL